MSDPAQHARRLQAMAEVRRLRSDLDAWMERCRAADVGRGQYETQLAAIHSEVQGAAKILDAALGEPGLGGTVGAMYEQCADIERQTVWLWGVWDYFREKFDQRFSGDERSALVQAADEVVWSCFRCVSQHPALSSRLGPAPIPYVEATYAAQAFRRDQHQIRELRRDHTHVLVRQAFRELPVSLVALPVTALTCPWSLVLVAHEVGHIVQPALADAYGYVKSFGQALRDGVSDGDHAEDDRARWHAWSEEVFADWFAVLTTGTAALWTIGQFEQGTAATLLNRRRIRYPAPVVRLALLAALADHHGMAGSATLAEMGLNPAAIADSDPAIQRDLATIPAIVNAITRELPDGLGTLDRLIGTRAGDFATTEGPPIPRLRQWSNYLLGRSGQPAERRLETARLVAAASADAWARGVAGAEAIDPAGVAATLRQAIPAAVRSVAVPGTRSVSTRSAPAAEPGRRLADLLSRTAQQSRITP